MKATNSINFVFKLVLFFTLPCSVPTSHREKFLFCFGEPILLDKHINNFTIWQNAYGKKSWETSNVFLIVLNFEAFRIGEKFKTDYVDPIPWCLFHLKYGSNFAINWTARQSNIKSFDKKNIDAHGFFQRELHRHPCNFFVDWQNSFCSSLPQNGCLYKKRYYLNGNVLKQYVTH